MTGGPYFSTETSGQPTTIHCAGDGTHPYARLCDGYFEGTVAECPLHQASFDVKTGQVINGPARTSLDTFPTRISNEWIELEVPDS